MTLSKPNDLLKDPSPNTITWRVKTSTYKFWGTQSRPQTFKVVLVIKNLLLVQEMEDMSFQFLAGEGSLEEVMATHCTSLTCRIPWTEEPGRLQSTGSQRVRHDRVTSHTIRSRKKQTLLEGRPHYPKANLVSQNYFTQCQHSDNVPV